jgi:hypothetical protein
VINLDSRIPDIWLRAFWGFAPWEDGYVGWTRETDRDRILREATQGDLALIYGAVSAETEDDDRRQVLGLLQLDLQPIRDVDKSSPIGLRRKIDNGWTDRWTHAIPVRRAWRIDRRIELRHLAPVTYTHNRARVIASRGERLTDAERDAVLQLPVTEVGVWGEPPVGERGAVSRPLSTVFTPSRGLPPTFGAQTVVRPDGVHLLYMLRFTGDAAALLDREPRALHRKALVKVGFSSDPMRRLDEINAAVPPAAPRRWILWLKSAPYASGDAAKLAEDALKADLSARFESLGGEFFLGDETALSSRFAMAPNAAAVVIRA